MERLLSGESAFNLDPEVTSDFFKKGVADPLLREFDREIAPRISEAFAGSGATFGSRRGFETGRVLEGLNTSLASELAKGQFNHQALAAQLADNAAGRQVQGIAAAEQADLAPFQRAGAFQSLASPFQAFEQSRRQALFDEFIRTSPSYNPAINQGIQFSTAGTKQPVQEDRVGITDFGGPLGIVTGGIFG